MADKVSREVAEREINSWLDQKKVFQSVRDSDAGKQNIEDLVGFVMQGVLEVNDDGTLTHNLMFPLGEGASMLKQLKYRSRINDIVLQPYLKGVPPTDAFGVFLAYAAAATDESKNILRGMDSGTDKKVMQAIVSFFF